MPFAERGPVAQHTGTVQEKIHERLTGKEPQRTVSFAADNSHSAKPAAAKQTTGSMAFLGKDGRLRKPTNLTLLEKKAWFLGRFLTKNVNEESLAKLRSVIRINKGIKTKLKLTSSGLVSGSKSNGFIRTKVPYEFAPLEDVMDVIVDSRFGDVILCIYRLTEVQYELVAYRMSTSKEAEIFSATFSEMTASASTDSPSELQRFSPHESSTSGYSQNQTFDPYLIESDDGKNWTFREKMPEYAVFTMSGYSPKTGQSSRMNFVGNRGHSVPNKPSSRSSGRSTPDFVSLVTPSSMVSYRDVAVAAKIEDPRDKDRNQKTRFFFDRQDEYYEGVTRVADVQCQAYVKPPFTVTINPKLDVISDAPASSAGISWPLQNQMRKEIDSLQEEVKHLRNLLGTVGIYRKDAPDFVDNTMKRDPVVTLKEGVSTVEGTAKIKARDYRENQKENKHQMLAQNIHITHIDVGGTSVDSNQSKPVSLHGNSTDDIDTALTSSVRRLHHRPPSGSRIPKQEASEPLSLRRYPVQQHPPVDKRRARSADHLIRSPSKESRSTSNTHRPQIQPNDQSSATRPSRSRVKGNAKDLIYQNAPDKRRDYLLVYKHPTVVTRSHSSSRYEAAMRGRPDW